MTSHSRPRPAWLVTIAVGTTVFAAGVVVLVTSWRDVGAIDSLILGAALAGAGLLLDAVGTVGMVVSALRSRPRTVTWPPPGTVEADEGA